MTGVASPTTPTLFTEQVTSSQPSTKEKDNMNELEFCNVSWDNKAQGIVHIHFYADQEFGLGWFIPLEDAKQTYVAMTHYMEAVKEMEDDMVQEFEFDEGPLLVAYNRDFMVQFGASGHLRMEGWPHLENALFDALKEFSRENNLGWQGC
jgi:hypothetical protein